MSFLQSNYWLTTASMPAGSAGELPARADVVVVGAGFTGLSAARRLAQLGVNTVVLEANSIGWGASSRNGGMVLTGLKLSPQKLASRCGMELTRRMYAASLASIDLVKQTVTDEGIECSFSRCGHLEVASKPSHFKSYAESAEFIAREFSHQICVVPRERLAEEIGSSIYFGGIVDETSAGVNPARYVAGLAQGAMKAGARVYESAQVVRVVAQSQDGSNGFSVRTSRGEVFAENVLIGTSGYTSGATPALRRKIIPIGSFIIATEPLPDELARELSPRNRMIYDSKHYLHYYRLTPDNRMLFGGRAAFFPETGNTIARSSEILRREMIEVFPQLREVKVEHAWGGTLDFCFDTMPHSGKMGGIYYALGYAGHGVAMATYLGSKIGEEMCGRRTDNPFSEIGFPGAPFGLYDGRPWFLPFAGAYYKVLDWIS